MKTDAAGLTALMIAGSGVLIGAAGVAAWCWRDSLVGQMRYILPVPPLGVAAYVFVISLLRDRPEGMSRTDLIRETAVGGGAAALVFVVFTIALLLIQRFWR